jgi:hypothetical protein
MKYFSFIVALGVVWVYIMMPIIDVAQWYYIYHNNPFCTTFTFSIEGISIRSLKPIISGDCLN